MYICSQAIVLTFDLQGDQTADVAKETEEESKTTSPCKPAVIRDNTMVTTAQVREGGRERGSHDNQSSRQVLYQLSY